MEFNRWKVVAGCALVGVVAGGIAGADSGGIDLNDRRPSITLSDAESAQASVADDGSPESADSPNESVEESVDSPFDSPDDARYFVPPPPPAPAPAPAPAADSFDSPASPVSVDSPASVDSN